MSPKFFLHLGTLTIALPSFQNNCIEKWEEKVDAIVDETIKKDMSLISGIPPWVQMYFEKCGSRNDRKLFEFDTKFEPSEDDTSLRREMRKVAF